MRIRQIRRDEHAGPDDDAAASRPVAPAGGEQVTGARAAAPVPHPSHPVQSVLVQVPGRLYVTVRAQIEGQVVRAHQGAGVVVPEHPAHPVQRVLAEVPGFAHPTQRAL